MLATLLPAGALLPAPSTRGGVEAGPKPPSSVHREHLLARGNKVCEFGRYKHSTYDAACQDEGYRRWVMGNIDEARAQPVQQPPPAPRFMAIHDGIDYEQVTSSEGDLVAIVDAGCNMSCRGSRWLERYTRATNQPMPPLDDTPTTSLRGIIINGSVVTGGTRHLSLCLELVDGGIAKSDLQSTELCDSDAPLLLSVQAQKALGLIIDVAGEVVHSQTLGQDLKLVFKDGLLAIRLLPGDLELRQGPMPSDATEPQSLDDDLSHSEDGRGWEIVEGEKPHVMNKQQHGRMKDGAKTVRTHDRHLWNQIRPERHRRPSELPRGCRTFLLEIFAGAAILTQVAFQDFGVPVSPPVDLNTGCNLLTSEGRAAVDRVIGRDDPFAISFAPVCTPWTSWTNILTGAAKEKVMKNRKQWRPVIKWMYDVVERRLNKGCHVSVENPWNSAMRSCRESTNFFEKGPKDAGTVEPAECVKVDQCAYGLRDHDNHLPHLKPTGFLTASLHVKQESEHGRCPGDHVHQQLDTKARCVRAQEWPHAMCEAIVYGWIRELGHCYIMVAFPAEAEQEIGISEPDKNVPDYLLKKQQAEMEVIYEEEPAPPPPAPDGGSCTAGSHYYVQLVPTRVPSVDWTTSGEYRFNKAISFDVFICKDASGRKYKIMSVVDLGTLFHVAAIVGEGSGPPASGDMAKALSAYQLGRGERQGGILKDIMKTTILARQLRGRQNMEFVVTESVGVKNHRINHNGFSPAQWVLGRNPPEIDALTTLDASAKLGVHQEILDGETSFAQQMVIRGKVRRAEAHFLWEISYATTSDKEQIDTGSGMAPHGSLAKKDEEHFGLLMQASPLRCQWNNVDMPPEMKCWPKGYLNYDHHESGDDKRWRQNRDKIRSLMMKLLSWTTWLELEDPLEMSNMGSLIYDHHKDGGWNTEDEGQIEELHYDKVDGEGFDAVEIIAPENVQAILKEHPDVTITPTRWVDNNKAQPWEDPRYKSRIVVRGDLESGADEARTDSPTASSVMLNLLLSVIANMEWRLRGGDITASFLQGDVIERVLILKPPPGGLPGVPPGALLRASKPVYGTKDAPRGFWKRLHKVATSKGLKAAPHEHAAYVLQGEGGRIDGMVIAHVDDLLWGGTEAMDKVMDEITKESSNSEASSLATSSTTVGGPLSKEQVRPIYVDAARKKQRDSPVTEPERNQLRSVVGSLNWLVRVCRVDLAYEVHRLQSIMSKAIVEDLVMRNQILNYVKKTSDKGLFYKYKAFDLSDATIYSITDASHAADFDVSTTGEPLGTDPSPAIFYYLDRASSGTLGRAETLSMVSGYEGAEHLRQVLHGLHTLDKAPGEVTDAMDKYNLVMMTDCKILEQHLKQPGLHTDKRLAIDPSDLRQLVWRLPGEDFGDPMVSDRPPESATTTVTWIDTASMLADGLTKRMSSPQLDEMMKYGTVSFSFVKIDGSRPKKILKILGV
ncbi:RE2 [Symbiodinium sp. CCMP2592]|nr:RE2 [Symbiodinium sp. CCMP2592]